MAVSLAEKVKVASVALTVPVGPVSMVVSGGVVSGGGGPEAAAWWAAIWLAVRAAG